MLSRRCTPQAAEAVRTRSSPAAPRCNEGLHVCWRDPHLTRKTFVAALRTFTDRGPPEKRGQQHARERQAGGIHGANDRNVAHLVAAPCLNHQEARPSPAGPEAGDDGAACSAPKHKKTMARPLFGCASALAMQRTQNEGGCPTACSSSRGGAFLCHDFLAHLLQPSHARRRHELSSGRCAHGTDASSVSSLAQWRTLGDCVGEVHGAKLATQQF